MSALSWVCSWAFPYYSNKKNNGFGVVVELKNRYMPDVRLDGVTAGLTYILRLNDKKADTQVFLTGGLGVGRHHLDINGLAGDTAWGGYATIALEAPSPTLGCFVEARYQMLNFDTVFGELDASGFEVVVGIRFNWSALRYE